ncbi:PP2C family protein-serine/threonine phosphatase [Sporosarcina sp. FSL K6-3457]|uniref:PP2C family protein-serine/threonine phosphatase n=1 Tax=Sporosarcina sp. FSL K6-3457 TaxID=2978204 RepID=UPI0030F80271
MRKDNSEFKTSFLSEAGSFIQNKDYFAYMELDDVACWVVVKGLDSDREVNSAELAVKAILEKFMEKPSMSRSRIKKYINNAQEVLQAQSIRVRLKASIVMVVSDYSKIICAVAGNSRLYHFRNGRLFYQSNDQSLARELLNGPDYSLGIDHHEERNNLLNYLGKPNAFQPFVSKKIKLMDGDALLLCTSGLWEEVSELEMADALEGVTEPGQYTDVLEEVLLSRQKKIIQNYTMVAIFANKVYLENKKKTMKTIKLIIISLFLLLLVGGGTIFYKVKEAKKAAEITAEMLEHEKTGNLYFDDGNYDGALKEFSEGRNAAKKVKNPIHRSLLAKKLRITQLIIGGDSEAQEGNLTEAITMYEKALKEGKQIQNFGTEEVELRITNMDAVVQILDAVKAGDFRFEAEDYSGALTIYEKARKQALDISYGGESDIKVKIDEAKEKIAELKRAQQELKAEVLEKSGDRSYDGQDFTKAIESYTLAQEIFQETDLLAKVLSVERKIMNAKEKLNPPPVPAPQVVPNEPPSELYNELIEENQPSDVDGM